MILNVERHDPDLWTDEFYFLNQPRQGEYPKRSFLRLQDQCGVISEVAGLDAKATSATRDLGKIRIRPFDPSDWSHRRDVPSAEVRIVDGGHFALDTAANEIASSVRNFMASSQKTDSISKRRTK